MSEFLNPSHSAGGATVLVALSRGGAMGGRSHPMIGGVLGGVIPPEETQ
jgi:hypothetical protein